MPIACIHFELAKQFLIGKLRIDRLRCPVADWGQWLPKTLSILAHEARKADPTAWIKELSSKGLLKYATAPALNARSRLLPSGNAVTKMTGVQYPFCSKCCCKSSPFSPGICKSVIRQTVLLT